MGFQKCTCLLCSQACVDLFNVLRAARIENNPTLTLVSYYGNTPRCRRIEFHAEFIVLTFSPPFVGSVVKQVAMM